jgi:hypothetical protein
MKDRIKGKDRSPVFVAQNRAERISKEMKGIMSCLNCVLKNGLKGLLKFEQYPEIIKKACIKKAVNTTCHEL